MLNNANIHKGRSFFLISTKYTAMFKLLITNQIIKSCRFFNIYIFLGFYCLYLIGQSWKWGGSDTWQRGGAGVELVTAAWRSEPPYMARLHYRLS